MSEPVLIALRGMQRERGIENKIIREKGEKANVFVCREKRENIDYCAK